jgi:hypothetical protein
MYQFAVSEGKRILVQGTADKTAVDGCFRQGV